jgi:uncharacterized cupin superfamily protein
MPKIDINKLAWSGGSGYPAPFTEITKGRFRKRLGDAVDLDQFGVNITRLAPGSGSALRHWHEQEDEFVYILEGQATLIEDDGKTLLNPGDVAGFKAGVSNGHHLVNESDSDLIYLEIGTRAATERAHYPDDDLAVTKDENGYNFTHKNGDAYL